MAKDWATSAADPAVSYQRQGFFVFRNVLDREAIGRLLETVEDEVIRSDREFRRHPRSDLQANRYVEEPSSGRRIVANPLLDPHRHSETPRVAEAIRRLICTHQVADLLHSVDAAEQHTIHQTIIFFTSPATDMHMDGWGLDSQPFGYSHTMWLPLEPVTLLNGPLALVPWPLGRFVSPQELGMGGNFLQGDDDGAREDYHQYHERLDRFIRLYHPVTVVPQLEPGDIVLFSSLTPHRTLPSNSRYVARMAMQIMLRDSSRAWGSWPQQLREGLANPPDEPKDRLRDVHPRWRILI